MIAKHPSVVISDAEILGGVPVFAGTRVPIDSLLVHLKAGDTIDAFLADFPSVSRAQVEAFLDLTADLIMENGRNAHSA
ncbi:MAG: DUF433 domain-containing protein [Planctomycetes bacterium]|nr:DUF433 domain-containing protein [Planctomycetota bacterium]